MLGARVAILTLGCLVLVGAVIWVATFPVTVTT